MAPKNGFELHHLKHSSVSQINKWIEAPDAWIAHYLFGHRGAGSSAMWRGIFTEQALVGVLAQRLVRVLCLECREAYEATPEALAEIGVRHPGRPVKLFKPGSCVSCSYSGYHGRMAIFELMLVDDEIRNLVSSNVDSKTIKHKAVANGMGTLRADGARKVLRGITSIAEVVRATEEEGAVAQI